MSASGEISPHVFISYSHDSVQHLQAVLDLSDRLRSEGIDCEIDQYVESPPEGFPTWAKRQIEQADFVPLIFTATYARRFSGEDGGEGGLGGRWEGGIISQAMYEAAG